MLSVVLGIPLGGLYVREAPFGSLLHSHELLRLPCAWTFIDFFLTRNGALGVCVCVWREGKGLVQARPMKMNPR